MFNSRLSGTTSQTNHSNLYDLIFVEKVCEDILPGGLKACSNVGEMWLFFCFYVLSNCVIKLISFYNNKRLKYKRKRSETFRVA